MFAAAVQVPRLLEVFERECLRNYTPCTASDGDALAEAIAITHVELILIHPFREGNGRLARLLADAEVTKPQASKSPSASQPSHMLATRASRNSGRGCRSREQRTYPAGCSSRCSISLA